MRPPLKLLRSFHSSYWFLPSLMVVVAIGFGALMVWLDAGPAAGLLDGISWYQKSRPEGAREVLSVIAGSMITVAGVVFSITIVAIAYAASQYGPRILTNFMSDRGNQITLGTFIATFVYSVVVLRTIQSGEQAFVPQLAVFLALLLALCSIIVLIYFINHVPESIDINSVTARIGRDLIAGVGKHFPAGSGDPPERSHHDDEALASAAAVAFAHGASFAAIACDSDGYLQAIDDHYLLVTARKHGLILRIEMTPGNFAFHGRALALAAPAERVTGTAQKQLRNGWSVGTNRTPEQDLFFLIDELVEISARALSPGVNDPYTAMTCMDWLTAAAAEMARREPPSPYRVDEEGELRVIVPVATFDLHFQRGFGRNRPYAATDINAATHFLSRIVLLARECRSPAQVDTLRREANALFELAQCELEGPSLDRLRHAMEAAREALRCA